MRSDVTLLNRFVETLSRQSSAFDFPYRGKKLVADSKVSRSIVLEILRGTPSERFAESLFPFLNLVDEERLVCSLAPSSETDLTKCPVVVIDAAGEIPHFLASSFEEFVGLLPWGCRLLIEIAEHVTRFNQRDKKGTRKTPQEKFATKVSKARKEIVLDLPARLGFANVTPVEDPILVIVSANEQHQAGLR